MDALTYEWLPFPSDRTLEVPAVAARVQFSYISYKSGTYETRIGVGYGTVGVRHPDTLTHIIMKCLDGHVCWVGQRFRLIQT